MHHRIAIAVTALALILAGCGGEDAGGSVAGTYELVKDQALLDGVKAVASHDTGAASEEALAQIQSMVDGMSMTLQLKEDGTFEVNGTMGEEMSASGTWKEEGSEVVLTTTHENGKKREEPDIVRFTREGTSLRMPKNEKDQPFDMVLQRK